MKGLSNEVIQIGAVMLDEKLNYLSQFSTFIKPVYGVILAETVDNSAYYKESLEHADTFSTAKYCHIKFSGNRDSALCYAFNEARIFYKLMKHNKQIADFNPLWKYTETELSKYFYTTKTFISKIFPCSKYGITVNKWLKFSTKMLFIKDVNYIKFSGDVFY